MKCLASCARVCVAYARSREQDWLKCPHHWSLAVGAIRDESSAVQVGRVTGVHKIETGHYRSAREAARDILELIHDIVGLRICVLSHIDLETNTLTVLEASDRAGLGVESGQILPADAMPCACVARTEATLREYDLDAVEPFRRLPACTKMGLRSYIGVPLRRSNGSIWGTRPRRTPSARK